MPAFTVPAAWFNERGFQVSRPRSWNAASELGPYLDNAKLPPNFLP
jgi:hypothetical protein